MDIDAMLSETLRAGDVWTRDTESLTRGQVLTLVGMVLEEAAKACDQRYMGDNNREDAEARRCAATIRAMKP